MSLGVLCKKFQFTVTSLAILATFGVCLPKILRSRVIYDQVLYLDNAYTGTGELGIIDLCDEGAFVTAIEIKYETAGHLDETAINGVKLYCAFPNEPDYVYVTSSVGTHGDWYGLRPCNGSDMVTGFRANVLSYQGPFTDDVAVENMEAECGHGNGIIAGLPIDVPKRSDIYDFQAGVWSGWATCAKNSAVCGIQTKYEDGSVGDEVSIADILLFCCQTPTVE